MQNKKQIDLLELFQKVLGNKINDFILPPPSFEVMQCEIITFDDDTQSLTVRVPVLVQWLNPYGTMQGGMIDAAIDNAVGPLSMLVASKNMTRTMETKFLIPITMDLGYIYVTATLLEVKKRRLIFDVLVSDAQGEVYASSRVVNFMIR